MLRLLRDGEVSYLALNFINCSISVLFRCHVLSLKSNSLDTKMLFVSYYLQITFVKVLVVRQCWF